MNICSYNIVVLGRPKRKRLIRFNPEVTYFKPIGVPLRLLAEENLTLDELEAVRLADLEKSDQEAAAKKMNISRVTFLRIIHSAHQKIAKALIYGKALSLKGGEYIMPNLDGRGPSGRGDRRRGFMPGRGQGLGSSVDCVCPKCGEKASHTRGIPCFKTTCPKCGTPMAGFFCRP
jgi:predicted DNA-binding protein (UPF0251 family)